MRAALALAVLTLALIGAACGGDDPSGDAAPAPVEPAAPAEQAAPPAPPEAEPELEPEGAPAAPSPSDAGNGQATSDVSCELERVPSQVPLEGGIVHVDALPDGFEYNSIPASQGPHHPEWLRWGVYDRPIPELNVVHNLEHGGLTIQYGPDVSDDDVAGLLAWFEEDSDAIIIAPHDGLGREIALAAWTVDNVEQDVDSIYRSSVGNVLHCDGFDAAAFSAFRDDFRGRAPERIPIELMPAGSQ